jgi:hypothetical protein
VSPGIRAAPAIGWDQCSRLAVMRRLFVAEPALVPHRAHLLLVAVPLQVLGCEALWRLSADFGWLEVIQQTRLGRQDTA